MPDAHLAEEDLEVLRTTNSSHCRLLLPSATAQGKSIHWAEHATIRHSNLVLFTFRHLEIPEDEQDLKAYLMALRVSTNIARAVTYILELLSEENAVTITMNGVHQLDNLWFRTNNQQHLVDDRRIHARIQFHTYVRPKDAVTHESTLLGYSVSQCKSAIGNKGLGNKGRGIKGRQCDSFSPRQLDCSPASL